MAANVRNIVRNGQKLPIYIYNVDKGDLQGGCSMDRSVLLWVDFAHPNRRSALPNGIESQCIIHRVTGSDEINTNIQLIKPDIVCFDYDYPDYSNRMALVEVKNANPDIPIIILTEESSEELAIWALRNHVWDYLVKPVSVEDIVYPLTALYRRREIKGRNTATALSAPDTQKKVKELNRYGGERIVSKAKVYIENHLEEPLWERAVAEECHVSPSHFSRVFKKHCGIGFSEYVLKMRITEASKLLIKSEKPVSEVAYYVGFQDPSYFSRVFKRYVGMTPSQFQDHYQDSSDESQSYIEELLFKA